MGQQTTLFRAHQCTGKGTDNPEEGGATEHDDELPECVGYY